MARTNNDDTTEKLFPPPENPDPDAPIPVGPSLRIVWKKHQEDIETRLTRFESLLEEKTAPTPRSAARKVVGGAILTGKVGVYVTGILGILAMAARLLGREDVATPIEQIQQLTTP